MDPLRTLLDVLVVFTALSVIIGLLFSKRRNPSRNPLILTIMVFLTVLIVWLACLGGISLLKGCGQYLIATQPLVIIVLSVSIIALSFLRMQSHRNPFYVLMSILGVLWILLLSILSVIGLNSVTLDYVIKNTGTWAILSLSISLALQIALIIQKFQKEGGQDGKGLNLRREDNSGRENSL